jgi:hypothetical protein
MPKKTSKKKIAGASAKAASPPSPPPVVEVEVPSVPERTERGTFHKGVSGNPAGRPKGTRNWITIERENLELVLRQYMNKPEQRAKAVKALDRLFELAISGEDKFAVGALKVLLDKIVPSPKSAEEAGETSKPQVHIVIENATKEVSVIEGSFEEQE